MLPIQITITPTMLAFKCLPDEIHQELSKVYNIEAHSKGYHFIKGSPQELYKVLLKLSYTYDIEIF